MITAVVGSRSITMRVDAFIPVETEVIVTGGAKGVDTAAEDYARRKGLPCVVIRPDYARYGRRAPLVRDREIVDRADMVIILWDGTSNGTAYTLRYAEETGKEVRLYVLSEECSPDVHKKFT